MILILSFSPLRFITSAYNARVTRNKLEFKNGFYLIKSALYTVDDIKDQLRRVFEIYPVLDMIKTNTTNKIESYSSLGSLFFTLDPFDIIGREDESVLIIKCLSMFSIIVLNGKQGIGKTSLVYKIAQEWEKEKIEPFCHKRVVLWFHDMDYPLSV